MPPMPSLQRSPALAWIAASWPISRFMFERMHLSTRAAKTGEARSQAALRKTLLLDRNEPPPPTTILQHKKNCHARFSIDKLAKGASSGNSTAKHWLSFYCKIGLAWFLISRETFMRLGKAETKSSSSFEVMKHSTPSWIKECDEKSTPAWILKA